MAKSTDKKLPAKAKKPAAKAKAFKKDPVVGKAEIRRGVRFLKPKPARGVEAVVEKFLPNARVVQTVVTGVRDGAAVRTTRPGPTIAAIRNKYGVAVGPFVDAAANDDVQLVRVASRRGVPGRAATKTVLISPTRGVVGVQG